ncbi:hypothetical protein BLA14095_06299 [Burkholderia lata]|uniref:hypothetical protein n=1 Tax=Burkholderia lata (strain ATCC 17760 / DSM 23089 / LMG 22485 / NCIMB 9086 / R18194 / 383) TaxID=482957 RepID=UPI001452AE06|nr:hypothetical protein [Burkholderia lata]VWC31002.1 hypothetical protein BLA14095_06299 [Burkholderia lata]
MAGVTNITTIINETELYLTIRSGETNDLVFIEGGEKKSLSKSFHVPWIGNQNEAKKAIDIKDNATSNVLAYLFQDYWQPPHKDAVKYCTAVFSYEQAHEVDGNNRGAGGKVLYIKKHDSGIKFFME